MPVSIKHVIVDVLQCTQVDAQLRLQHLFASLFRLADKASIRLTTNHDFITELRQDIAGKLVAVLIKQRSFLHRPAVPIMPDSIGDAWRSCEKHGNTLRKNLGE